LTYIIYNMYYIFIYTIYTHIYMYIHIHVCTHTHNTHTYTHMRGHTLYTILIILICYYIILPPSLGLTNRHIPASNKICTEVCVCVRIAHATTRFVFRQHSPFLFFFVLALAIKLLRFFTDT